MCVYISFFKFYPHSPVKKKTTKHVLKVFVTICTQSVYFFEYIHIYLQWKHFSYFGHALDVLKILLFFPNFYYPRDIRNSKKIHYSKEVFSKIWVEQIHKGQILKCGFNNLQTTLNNYKQMLTIVFLFMYIFYLYL